MNGRPWTKQDDEIVISRYPHENTDQLAKELNRRSDNVRDRARKLNVRKTKEAYDAARREAYKREGYEINKLPFDQVPIAKAYMNKTWLENKYLVDEYSTLDIADMVGVEKTTILRWLDIYNIPRRSNEHTTDRTREKISSHASKRSGPQVGRWNGGQTVNQHGYRYVLMPDHPNANGNGYVAEHRLVMEFLLARLLSTEEVVHHRDSNRLNNFSSNLFLFPNSSAHAKFHAYKRFKEPGITEEEYMYRFYDNSKARQ